MRRYIADKDQLQRNDGDYYRVRSEAALPPTEGWALAQDGCSPIPRISLAGSAGASDEASTTTATEGGLTALRALLDAQSEGGGPHAALNFTFQQHPPRRSLSCLT